MLSSLAARALAGVALSAALFFGGFWKGHQWATAQCREAELAAVIAARDETIARFAEAARQSDAERQAKAAEAARDLAVSEERARSLNTDHDIANAAGLALEQELAALAKDKDHLNALIAKLSKAKGTGRRATRADVDFDRRMLGERSAIP